MRSRGTCNHLLFSFFLSPCQRTMDRRNNFSVQQNGSARCQIQHLVHNIHYSLFTLHSPHLILGILQPKLVNMYKLQLFCHLLVVVLTVQSTAAFLQQRTPIKPPVRNIFSNMIARHSTSDGTMVERDSDVSIGIYRPFASYAWSKLISSGLVDETDIVPQDLRTNSSPSRGPEGTVVNIEVKSCSGTNTGSGLRLGRYALLETLTPSLTEGEMESLDDAIHVLNFVLFPSIEHDLPLPVLGMDLVTLPGQKHLIAIDFQPVLPPAEGDECSNENNLFGGCYAGYEQKLADLYRKHVTEQPDVLPWGGDIPGEASRFFSKYTIWTRLKGDEGLNIIQNEVYNAFCDYLDLYIDLMKAIQKDQVEMDSDVTRPRDSLSDIEIGNQDYLSYRQQNDPARPMLTRLFGSEWTEELISTVLFKDIQSQ